MKTWMLEYIIEPKSIAERRERLAKVLKDLEEEE